MKKIVVMIVLVMICIPLIGCIGDGRSSDGKGYDPFNDRWNPLYKLNPLRHLDPLKDFNPWNWDD
jgi:hypothetical protein